jgi:N-acyl-D-amino-acid deacylase
LVLHSFIAPAFFAKTNELIELCKAAAPYGGSYISHMRSEGNKLHDAVEELITIAKEAKVHGEIYHLKAVGIGQLESKIDSVIKRIERARKEGIDIAANMYTYTAGATGYDSCPPSFRYRMVVLENYGNVYRIILYVLGMIKAMKTNAADWENLYYGAGSADNVLLLGIQKRFTF